MLGKLIKHDFRALSRILFPLQIGILAGGIVASLFMTIDIRIGQAAESNADGLLWFAFTGMSGVLMFLIAVCIAASALVTLLFILIRFYRSLLGSEGYLTFTLPTTTGRILWSKLITGVIWCVINAAVICIAILIFAVFGTAGFGLVNPDALAVIRGMFSELPEIGSYVRLWLVIPELIVFAIVSLAAMLLQAFFAVTVGGRAAKHHLLASIGMYIVLGIGANMIRTFVSIFASFSTLGMGALNAALDGASVVFQSLLLWNLGIAAVLCVVFFLGTRALLKNKLNLQ